MNYIECIQKEIKEVEKIISSKKDLIVKYPDDKILISSLKTFEQRKRDLLRKIEPSKNRTLDEELEYVQELIIENKKLQKQSPYHKKELEAILSALKKFENEVLTKLNSYNHNKDLNIKMETKNF